MDVNDAINIVAHQVLADSADNIWDGWEGYPEIGEDDWEEVCKRAKQLLVTPSHETYLAAYAVLESRAEYDG